MNEAYFPPRLSGFFIFLLSSVILISSVLLVFFKPTTLSTSKFLSSPIPTPPVNEIFDESAVNTSGWKTSTNDGYKFKIQYPKGFKVSIPKDNEVIPLGFMTTCDGKNPSSPWYSIVCLSQLKDPEYSGTNFEEAAVSVNIIKNAITEADCPPEGLKFEPNIPIIINGVTFKKSVAGEGATGHTEQRQLYRTFFNNKCYELRISLDKYREEEPFKVFTVKDEKTVLNLLKQVLSTFKFTQ